jgi:translocator protein
MAIRLFIFLAINFAALALGGIFTGKGSPSEWYQELAKAPWTPPGWTFGAAWTTIMICFSFFMAYAWNSANSHKILIALFVVQWILNVGWSPIFFHYHFLTFGFITISALTILIAWMMIYYFPQTKYWTLLLLPYLVWLMIATSLNGYILLKN